MMTTAELIAKVAKQHQVILKESDPIFITLTLNELVLAKYLEEIRSHQELAQENALLQMNQQVEVCKGLSQKLVTEASAYIIDQVKFAVDEVLEQRKKDIEEALTKVQPQPMIERVPKHYVVLFIVACLISFGIGWLIRVI